MPLYLILIILILNISIPAYGENEGKSPKKSSILRWLQLPDYGKKTKRLKLNKGNEVSWSKPAPKIPHGQMRLEESVALALRHNRTIKSAYLNRISEKYTLEVAEDEFNFDYSITPQYGLSSTGRTDPPEGLSRVYSHSYGSSFSLSKRAKTGGSFSFAWANSIQIRRFHQRGHCSQTKASPALHLLLFASASDSACVANPEKSL